MAMPQKPAPVDPDEHFKAKDGTEARALFLAAAQGAPTIQEQMKHSIAATGDLLESHGRTEKIMEQVLLEVRSLREDLTRISLKVAMMVGLLAGVVLKALDLLEKVLVR